MKRIYHTCIHHCMYIHIQYVWEWEKSQHTTYTKKASFRSTVSCHRRVVATTTINHYKAICKSGLVETCVCIFAPCIFTIHMLIKKRRRLGRKKRRRWKWWPRDTHKKWLGWGARHTNIRNTRHNNNPIDYTIRRTIIIEAVNIL